MLGAVLGVGGGLEAALVSIPFSFWFLLFFLPFFFAVFSSTLKPPPPSSISGRGGHGTPLVVRVLVGPLSVFWRGCCLYVET